MLQIECQEHATASSRRWWRCVPMVIIFTSATSPYRAGVYLPFFLCFCFSFYPAWFNPAVKRRDGNSAKPSGGQIAIETSAVENTPSHPNPCCVVRRVSLRMANEFRHGMLWGVLPLVCQPSDDFGFFFAAPFCNGRPMPAFVVRENPFQVGRMIIIKK